MSDDDRTDTEQEFARVVNMTPATLRKWLDTPDSKAVGWPPDRANQESVGHHSGRRIVEIKSKTKTELTDDDLSQMRKVIGYVHRHLAQRPDGDVTNTRWRYSLMNWGHDPLQDR